MNKTIKKARQEQGVTSTLLSVYGGHAPYTTDDSRDLIHYYTLSLLKRQDTRRDLFAYSRQAWTYYPYVLDSFFALFYGMSCGAKTLPQA